jgi:hypothetical protein
MFHHVPFNGVVRLPIAHAYRYVSVRPRLKRVLERIAARIGPLRRFDAWLLAWVFPPAHPLPSSEPNMLEQLGVHARQIHADLEAIVASRRPLADIREK